MESRCCVSVVVPIYNVEDYLEECLDSIAAQSLESLEVLLIDDGSTDSSSSIAQHYADQYSHFKYYRKENGGLGSARNYGTDQASGEYVAYCDSDGTVPPFAYKRMYTLAKKWDCDIVSGDVDCFHENKHSESSLHRLAFEKASEHENAHQNSRLIFDSTTSNKLFKLKYIKSTGIRYPENIQFEDIATVIPLVCMTDNYAHLNEVVYSWRKRTESRKSSLAHSHTDWECFPDLLKAFQMVDEFFQNNVHNVALVIEKDYKWLNYDLLMFVNMLPEADESYRSTFMNSAAPYIRSVRPEAFARLEAVDRIKYYYLLNRDIRGLLKYLEFAKSSAAYKALPLTFRNKRYYGKFPFKIPSEYTDMTNEIAENGCSVAINTANLDETIGLKLEGRIFYSRLNASKRDDIEINAYLVSNEDNSLIKELPSAIVVDPNGKGEWLRNLKRHYLRYVKRDLVRYGIEVDWSLLSSLKPGRYHIEIAYHRNELNSKRVFAACPFENEEPRPFAIFDEGRRYAIDYDIYRHLILTIESIDDPIVDEVIIQKNKVMLQSNSETIAVHVLENLDMNDLQKLTTRINEKNYLYKNHDEIISSLGSFALRIFATNNGYLRLQGYGSSAVSIETTFDNSTFSFLITGLTGHSRLSDAKPVFIGQEHGVRIECDDFRFVQDGSILCRINVSRKDLANQLRADVYRLFLDQNEPGDSNHQLLPVLSKCRSSVKTKRISKQKYEYSLTNDGREGFCVSLAWHVYENSRHRRSVMQQKVYKPIYKVSRKLLPVDRNMVLFESYWGTQIGCSPAGIYRYLIRNHPEIQCTWLVNDERIPIEGNAKKVRKGTLPHYIAAARAHYLISNVHFDDWLEKRTEQILIQTTHGTPLKKVGLAAPNEFETEQAFERFAQDCARWDYLIASGPRAESILKDNYKFEGQFLRTGLPRNDSLFTRNNYKTIAKLREQYGIPDGKKLILYAPTWRTKNQFDLRLDLSKVLDEIGHKYAVGLRPHHLSVSGLVEEELDPRIINLASKPCAEDCYLMSDIVITDYSSLMFDVALLNKPLLFFVYDLEDYRDNLRGFNIDFEKEAPGPLLRTSDEVIAAINNLDVIQQDYTESYARFKKNYANYEHGNASEQIYNQIFNRTES